MHGGTAGAAIYEYADSGLYLVLTKNKKARNQGETRFRDRAGETLFIDARNLGSMKDRVLRDFAPEDIDRIAGTFHQWKRGEGYEDEAGYCKSATLDEIEKNDYVLTPGRYVGAPPEEDDGEPFAEKMARLTAELQGQFAESARLEEAIKQNLEGLGYGV